MSADRPSVHREGRTGRLPCGSLSESGAARSHASRHFVAEPAPSPSQCVCRRSGRCACVDVDPRTMEVLSGDSGQNSCHSCDEIVLCHLSRSSVCCWKTTLRNPSTRSTEARCSKFHHIPNPHSSLQTMKLFMKKYSQFADKLGGLSASVVP